MRDVREMLILIPCRFRGATTGGQRSLNSMGYFPTHDRQGPQRRKEEKGSEQGRYISGGRAPVL